MLPSNEAFVEMIEHKADEDDEKRADCEPHPIPFDPIGQAGNHENPGDAKEGQQDRCSPHTIALSELPDHEPGCQNDEKREKKNPKETEQTLHGFAQLAGQFYPPISAAWSERLKSGRKKKRWG